MTTAAADDFCDCPERAYLGTGWVEETEDGDRRDKSSVTNEVSREKTTDPTNFSCVKVLYSKQKGPVGFSSKNSAKRFSKQCQALPLQVAQSAKQSPLKLLRALPSVLVRIKSTHPKQTLCVCHRCVSKVGQVCVKRPLPPPNSLQIDLISHFASPNQSHEQLRCYVAGCILILLLNLSSGPLPLSVTGSVGKLEDDWTAQNLATKVFFFFFCDTAQSFTTAARVS